MQKCLEYKLKYRMIKTYLKVHLKCVWGGGGGKKEKGTRDLSCTYR